MKHEQKALLHLKKDKKLKKIIQTISLSSLTISQDIFIDIIEAIISQQLSGKAAETIFKRFQKLFDGKINPKNIVKIADEDIRACGISYSKIKYIKGLCTAVLHKELDLKSLYSLSDDEVVVQLIKIKGIGRWTAEMILMFSLGREDVFSLGDLGLRTAIANLYGIEREDRKEIEKVSLTWSPYRTLASRYLWKSLEKNSEKK